MPSILHETQEESGNLKYPYPESPFYSFQAPYYGVSNEKEVPPSSPSVSKISPLILLVITVLAVIFFVYGLVHLVLWFLMKRPSSSLFQSNRFPETTRSRALQRQLQQLFRLHDSGLDQSSMDSLPVFYYKDVMNLREPFDCAVCLCKFSDDDKLRLLPICSHAFHIHCIDTWLLSNSTCPLCRATLSSSGISMENPTFSFDNSRVLSNRVNGDEEDSGSRDNQRPVSGEEHNDEKRVIPVRLGKFKNINGIMGGENRREEETSSSCSLDARRCYSMGSYQYVEGSSNLEVILSGKSEEGDLRRDCSSDIGEEGKRIDARSRGESFSVSKIWLWSKRSQFHSSSNVAFPSLQ